MSVRRFVIVCGLSGAGKSQAMKSFEDLGYHVVDRIPAAFVREFVDLAEREGVARVVLGLDVFGGGAFGEALEALEALDARGIEYDLLFLEASDDAIVRRYGETRRRHPLEETPGLPAAIARERSILAELRARATHVVDTSALTHATLGSRIRDDFAAEPQRSKLAVDVVAFGFKYGPPRDADFVLDVRFLRNPNYEPALKERSGSDAEVAAFLQALPETAPLLERLFSLVDFLLPQYVAEGKVRLTLAIGCTGGRHRSVYVADRLARHLETNDAVRVTRTDRDSVAR